MAYYRDRKPNEILVEMKEKVESVFDKLKVDQKITIL